MFIVIDRETNKPLTGREVISIIIKWVTVIVHSAHISLFLTDQIWPLNYLVTSRWVWVQEDMIIIKHPVTMPI